MIARPTLRATVLIALALATPVLAGCGIEAKDETSKEHTQIQAAAMHIGAIRIRNAFITTLPGDATPAATASPAAGAAGVVRSYLVVTLVNNGAPDALTGVTTSLGSVTLNAGPAASVNANGLPLPTGVVVQVGDPELSPGAATITISGTAPKVGTTVPVTFSFATAGTTRPISVPVVDPGGSLSPTQVLPTDQATFSTPIE